MPEAAQHPASRLPDQDMVDAGCYIDFEGFAPNEYAASPPPVLIGIYNREQSGDFVQVVFTKRYRWAAQYSEVSHEVVYEPDRKGFLATLMSSTRRGKPFFAYSEHELKVLSKILESRQQTLVPRYKNVRSIAKRWLRQRSESYEKPETNDLNSVAAAMGITPPVQFPTGGMTARLRMVSEHSPTRAGWEGAPKAVRQAWKELLLYNQSDVMTIHQIMQHMCRQK
jgi:hypothetical protein|tara:strand:+ start:2216 stop:2890 length:675 start_codon:yes stop_codon:yes gene_type:complete